MHRIKSLLLVFLIASPICAWSQWVKVGENDVAEYFIDPTTVRQDNSLIRMWEIRSLNQRNAEGIWSRMSWKEFDCLKNRVRTLSFTDYSRPMANGDILLSDKKPAPWAVIEPGTVGASLHKLVCTK